MSNSVDFIKVVDAESLYDAFCRLGINVEEVDRKELVFTVSRQAMSSVGYYMDQSEIYEGTLPLHKKGDFDVTVGGPYSVSPYFVFPSQLNTRLVSAPEEEWDDSEGEDEAECLYYRPDEDSIWQEMEQLLDEVIDSMRNWVFDVESRAAGKEIEDCWKLQ